MTGATTRAADAPVAARGVTVYGAVTCEDTAVTRSRLDALGIPFVDVDVDRDPAGLARVIALEGRRVTPTVVFGDATAVTAEPTIERLEELLVAGGHRIEVPRATHVHGSLAERAIPLGTVTDASGEPVSLERYRGRRQIALFLAHDAGCLACRGYAKQLAGQAAAMLDADALPVVVTGPTPADARTWAEDVSDDAVVLADADGAWRRSVTAHLGLAADAVACVVLDRYLAPRAVSAAGEAGGLIGPGAATEWLRFVVLDCPECYGGATWPD